MEFLFPRPGGRDVGGGLKKPIIFSEYGQSLHKNITVMFSALERPFLYVIVKKGVNFSTLKPHSTSSFDWSFTFCFLFTNHVNGWIIEKSWLHAYTFD